MLRRPPHIKLGQTLCYVSGRPMAYGSVCMDLLIEGKWPPTRERQEIRRAKDSIEKTVRDSDLTFCKWSVTKRHHPEYPGHRLWHIAADVVWDEAYEKRRESP